MFWEILLVSLFIVVALYIYQQNYLHKKNEYKIFMSKFNQKLKGKKIIFISDTHFRSKISIAFVDRILIDIEKIQPDLIVFAGDIVHNLDSNHTLEYVKDFFLQLNNLAPSYLIYGNHDFTSKGFDEIEATLNLSGAKLLKNEAEWISFEDSNVGFWLMGLSDQSARIKQMTNPLKDIALKKGCEKDPKILLAHHPEFFESYLKDNEKRPDLVLTGHSHGGQVILPFLGGLFAPGQGILPKYDFGIFTNKKYPKNRMIVSKGLGNSKFPVRVNNRPEIVLIKLE